LSLTGRRGDIGAFVRSQVSEPAIEELLPMPSQVSGFQDAFKSSIEFKIFCQQYAPNI